MHNGHNGMPMTMNIKSKLRIQENAGPVFGSGKGMLLYLRSSNAPLRAEMQQFLKEVHREFPIPIVFVTHDVLEAYSMADKIIIYSNGSVAQTGTPKELFTNPACKEVEQLINTRARLLQSLESVPCIVIF